MTYPAAPAGKIWTRIKTGEIKRGDWIGLIRQYADGLIGDPVKVGSSDRLVYRLRDIPKPRIRTRYFTSATKFWDGTAYIRYVGEKGTIVNMDGTDWGFGYDDPLANAIKRVKSGVWKEITAKEALALTKPAPAKKSEAELLRAEVAALKAENATLWANEKTYVAKIADLQNKLAAARAAVETLKSL